jgi:hypothetical protein
MHMARAMGIMGRWAVRSREVFLVSFDVSINYASKDKVIADALCARLEAAGNRCWIAARADPMFSESAPGKMRLRTRPRN